jgi:hypothetical protein
MHTAKKSFNNVLCAVHVGNASRIQDDTRDYLKLTSSRVVVVEGGSVEFVCEASVSREEGGGEEEVEGEEGDGGRGQCVPYNVTWSVNSINGSEGALRQTVEDRDTFSTSSIALLNNHLLRVGGVSSGSAQYCCQVHAAATGHRISQECTTIHVLPQRGM